jgi:hypothetical protein
LGCQEQQQLRQQQHQQQQHQQTAQVGAQVPVLEVQEVVGWMAERPHVHVPSCNWFKLMTN